MKELNLAIEKMTKQVHTKKAALENEVTETQAAQIQLDKTAEDFRALHNERQDLVRQWEEAVQAGPDTHSSPRQREPLRPAALTVSPSSPS